MVLVIGLPHSPGLCPENQGCAGSKVLRIKKPSEKTILLCSLKRSPETSVLPLRDKKTGCSSYVQYTQLLDSIHKLSGTGDGLLGTISQEGQEQASGMAKHIIMSLPDPSYLRAGWVPQGLSESNPPRGTLFRNHF